MPKKIAILNWQDKVAKEEDWSDKIAKRRLSSKDWQDRIAKRRLPKKIANLGMIRVN